MKKTVKSALLALIIFSLMPLLTWAATESPDSELTIVDTRTNLVTVSGRVLHLQTRSGIAGVLVSVPGRSTITLNDGNFTLGSVSPGSSR